MIFLLLISVLGVMICAYFINAKYIMHPITVVGLVVLLSTVVAAANYSSWGDINRLTFVVVLLGTVAFMVGGAISSLINRRYCLTIRGKRIINNDEEFKAGIIISKHKTIIVVLFTMVVTFWYTLEMRKYAGSDSMFFLTIFTAARSTVYSGKAIILNPILQQCIYICKALAYVYIFYILYQRKIENKKVKLLYYIPIILYIIQIILSTSRSEIIYFVYAILIIYYCLNMKLKRWQQKNDYVFLKKMIKAFIIFIIIFVVLGNVRNTVNSSLFETFSKYIGSSIYALNNYIEENGILKNASFWGEETQYLYYSILRKAGISDKTTIVTLFPTYIGENEGIRTNIYTIFRRYLHDYGINGMAVILGFLGYLYTCLFEKIRKYDNRYLWIIFYAYLSYPLTEFAIEERFFNTLITARTVMCCIYIVLVYKIMTKDMCRKDKTY